jgi:hypothetical protein
VTYKKQRFFLGATARLVEEIWLFYVALATKQNIQCKYFDINELRILNRQQGPLEHKNCRGHD